MDNEQAGHPNHCDTPYRTSTTREGTHVTLVLDYAGLLGPLMAWQFKDLNWDYLTKEAAGLKRLCEP